MIKVIGLTGTLGSGKEVVKDYLKKNIDSFYVKLSDTIRNEMEKKKGKTDRTTMQDSGDEMRRKYGGGVLAKVSVDYLPRNKALIIVDGIRNPGEIEYLKKTFNNNFFLIAIDAPPEMRFERMKSRGRPDDPKTMEEFLAMDERDQGTGQPEYGQQVRRCMSMANFTIVNDGDVESLYAKVAEIVKSIFG